MSRRVVVTGVGLVSPLGIGTEPTWDGLVAGRSGVSTITRFDTSDFPVHIGAEVKGFEPERLDRARKRSRNSTSLSTTRWRRPHMALESSGLEITDENATRVGVVIGSGIGGFPMIERQHEILLNRGPRRVSPFFIPGAIINMCSGLVSIRTGAKGPNMATCTACSTSAHAIGDALLYIRHGYADAIIAGGSEAVISPMPLAGFSSMRALSTRNDEPERASRPWDKDRDGFVIGEGAGIVMLEELRARETARGADPRRGPRLRNDVGRLPHLGAIRGRRRRHPGDARRPRRCDPSTRKMSTTSTPTAPRRRPATVVETIAIKGVFGDHAHKLMVSSTKSMTGHLLGAAGGLEFGVVVQSLVNGIVPPTINLDNPDPENDLDYVAAHRPRGRDQGGADQLLRFRRHQRLPGGRSRSTEYAPTSELFSHA